MHIESPPRMEFHIARPARERYRFDESLYALTGNVVLIDSYAARVLAQRMNAARDGPASPSAPCAPGS